MNKPVVSVLMPIYNCRQFLHESISSILNQTYREFELIIIDGCSADNPKEVIDSFNDSRITFLRYDQANPARQLNYGLKHASGKYIARMDGDDISMPERFTKQVNFLEENPDIHLTGTNYIRIDEAGKILFKKKHPEHHYEIEYMMTVMPGLLHPTMMIRKDVLDDVNGYYDDQDFYIEDFDLYIRLLEKGYKFYNIQEYLFKYRLRASSLGSIYGKKQAEKICIRSREYLMKKYPNSLEKDLLCFRLALTEYYIGDIKKSREYFFKSINLNKSYFKKTVRYLPLILLPSAFVKFLRNKGILYFVSTRLNKYLDIDFFQFKK